MRSGLGTGEPNRGAGRFWAPSGACSPTFRVYTHPPGSYISTYVVRRNPGRKKPKRHSLLLVKESLRVSEWILPIYWSCDTLLPILTCSKLAVIFILSGIYLSPHLVSRIQCCVHAPQCSCNAESLITVESVVFGCTSRILYVVYFDIKYLKIKTK